MRRVLVIACLLLVAVGIVAAAGTSLNVAIRTFATPNGPVYLIDNLTGKTQTMIVFSFSGAVSLAASDIIVFGGGMVSAVHPWGGGLLVGVVVNAVPGATIQVSLTGKNAKLALSRAWFAPAT